MKKGCQRCEHLIGYHNSCPRGTNESCTVKDCNCERYVYSRTFKDLTSDPSWELWRWKDFIEDLIEEYGEQAVMYTNTGYNNVELMLRVDK